MEEEDFLSAELEVVPEEKYENIFKAYYTYEKGKNYTFLPIKIENVDLYKNQIKIW